MAGQEMQQEASGREERGEAYRNTAVQADLAHPEASSHRGPDKDENFRHRYVNEENFQEFRTELPPRKLEELSEAANKEEEEAEGSNMIDPERRDYFPDPDQEASHAHCRQHNHDLDNHNELDKDQQLSLLRDLLRVERANTERSRANNAAIKRYVQQLQMDYLKQQSDLMAALELGHKIKGQKEAQIATIEATVNEKEALIEQLRLNLANLDEQRLRREFEAALSKQNQTNQLELDQLRNQIQAGEQQLAREKAEQLQLSEQFRVKLDEQKRVHDKELAALCSQLRETRAELDRLLSEPQNLIIKALKEDKSALDIRLDEQNMVAHELQTKYDALKKRLESIMSEQEQSQQQYRDEVDKLQQQQADQRRSLSELKCELADKDEIIQVSQFNLQRSEKRVKNLLGAMKNQEETYRGMVAQMELKHCQEIEKIEAACKAAEKQLIANGDELDKKQNEIVRLRLTHENQLDSMRTDRDERTNRAALEKQGLEKELRATELKLAREIEKATSQARLIDQLHKEVKQFREESKRLSIELTKCEAKLYAKQQEFNQSIERLTARLAEGEPAEVGGESARLQQLKSELDEERRMSRKLNANIEELKKENGKLNVKLRIAESNLSRTSAAINREHGKMLREFEKKLEQIRSEQVDMVKSKMRYKRYGYKLKKYCEHLKRVHEHLCQPNVCGYVLGPLEAPAATDMSPGAKDCEKDPADCCDKLSSLLDENDSEFDSSNLGRVSNCSYGYFTDDHYSNRKTNQTPNGTPAPAERFIVKRTGLSPVLQKRTPLSRARKLSFRKTPAANGPRVPLRSRENLEPVALHACDDSNEHEYCYINEYPAGHLVGKLSSNHDYSTCCQADI